MYISLSELSEQACARIAIDSIVAIIRLMRALIPAYFEIHAYELRI